MGAISAIEWTDATWNPVTGCTKVMPGCDNCYAECFASRFRGTLGHLFENGFGLMLRPERLSQPHAWWRSRGAFANSMSDLFRKKIRTGAEPATIQLTDDRLRRAYHHRGVLC